MSFDFSGKENSINYEIIYYIPKKFGGILLSILNTTDICIPIIYYIIIVVKIIKQQTIRDSVKCLHWLPDTLLKGFVKTKDLRKTE